MRGADVVVVGGEIVEVLLVLVRSVRVRTSSQYTESLYYRQATRALSSHNLACLQQDFLMSPDQILRVAQACSFRKVRTHLVLRLAARGRQRGGVSRPTDRVWIGPGETGPHGPSDLRAPPASHHSVTSE